MIWNEFKNCLTTAANKTCGRTKRKNNNNKRVTWWWNSEISEAVTKKRKLIDSLLSPMKKKTRWHTIWINKKQIKL